MHAVSTSGSMQIQACIVLNVISEFFTCQRTCTISSSWSKYTNICTYITIYVRVCTRISPPSHAYICVLTLKFEMYSIHAPWSKVKQMFVARLACLVPWSEFHLQDMNQNIGIKNNQILQVAWNWQDVT